MPAKTSAKAQLRSEIRRALKGLSKTQIAHDSRLLREKLRFDRGSKVALFAGTPTEPMLLDLIRENREVRWFLPKITGSSEMEFIEVADPTSLQRGPFGIYEPSEGRIADSLDYIVCPGLAFTIGGKRLGQGGGFYDRALPRFPQAKILGVAFACQIVDNLPAEEHDLRMDLVLIPLPAAPEGTLEY